jgi:phenylacetate-CoA ligase
MRWLTRSGLAKAGPVAPGSIVFASSPAEYGVGLAETEVAAMQALSRQTLEAAGLGRRDRVLFTISHDGAPSVGLLAQAVQSLGATAAMASPRGRLRLLSTIRALKPNALVTTPCGAADFLARLYLEFNVDPIELELGKIVLVGEVASPGLRKRLAKEFEAEVAELYCDPIFGAAIAVRSGGGAWETAGALALAPLATDEISADGIAGQGEIVLRPTWSKSLGDTAIRTGHVIQGEAKDAGLFNHTVGEHVLVRGQWLSLPLLRKQLALIDGAARWTLTLDRGDRTLDSAALTIGLDRETLVANPMWKSRIQQAVAASTAIRVDIATEFAAPDDGKLKEAVIDLRGHHLAVDRAKAAA